MTTSYGELGYVIIHQTIYDLFPPASFDSESTLPLSPTEFIQLILVPEAAVSLIMDDLQQPRAQAIRTLRASAEYGVAMFPDEAGGSNVGENIVRERAKARRKALEAEGETVQDEDDIVEVEAPKKKRGRPRKIDRAEESDVAMLTDASRSGVSRPKPRPKKRGAGDAPSSQPIPNCTPTVLDLCDSTDSMTVSTSQEGARPRPKPRRRARAPNSDGHQSHTDASDSTEPETYVHKPEPIVVDVDVEETPRPAKLGKQPSGMVSSMLSVRNAQEIRQPTIMELARQRKRYVLSSTVSSFCIDSLIILKSVARRRMGRVRMAGHTIFMNRCQRVTIICIQMHLVLRRHHVAGVRKVCEIQCLYTMFIIFFLDNSCNPINCSSIRIDHSCRSLDLSSITR